MGHKKKTPDEFYRYNFRPTFKTLFRLPQDVFQSIKIAKLLLMMKTWNAQEKKKQESTLKEYECEQTAQNLKILNRNYAVVQSPL